MKNNVNSLQGVTSMATKNTTQNTIAQKPAGKATKLGGKREGSGRKAGGSNASTKQKLHEKAQAIENAKKTGLLPHEILLNIARGEPVIIHNLVITYHGPSSPKELRGKEKSREWIPEKYYPTFPEVLDAVKAAAPYFAPKLAAQLISANSPESLAAAMAELARKLPA